MSKEWTSKPLIEHIDHVWYDHGNLFSSQVRDQMDGDERAMELVEEFEESWRNLQNYVLNEIDDHRKKIREQKLKERIKPLIHKKLDELKRNK